jgi:hypothetical protein
MPRVELVHSLVDSFGEVGEEAGASIGDLDEPDNDTGGDFCWRRRCHPMWYLLHPSAH